MKMHDIQLPDRVMKCAAQRRCPIESPDQGTRKISDLNAIKIHRRSDWRGANARSIDVSGKDLHFVPSCRQCSAEAMDRKNWPSIAHSWQVAWDHMEDSHVPTLQDIDLSYLSAQ
jgi:hypothetical protein